MSSFYLGWKGSLFDKKLQSEFITCLSEYAKSHNKIYFGRRKDKTTLEVFDNTFIEGKILVPKYFFKCSHELFHPENFEKLNEKVFCGNLLSEVTIEKVDYFVCSKIRLNGIQFKLNTDMAANVFDKKYFSKISFVFFDFGDGQKHRSLIKQNIIEIRDKGKMAQSDIDTSKYNFMFTTNGFLYRYRNMEFVHSLCVFAKKYFVKNLEIDAFYLNNPVQKYLLDNDPEGVKDNIKLEVHQYLLEEFKKHAASCANSEIRKLSDYE
jgi:hypothetical protein